MKNIIRNRIRVALLSAAVVLLVTGIMTDGFSEVRSKAINICMECIGIG